ncbi:MAG: WYL domain-containing protein [Balneolaceae bacterium]
MPLNKSAYIRYQIIDECLRKASMRYPSSDRLLSEIKRITDQPISKETLQKDIHQMKNSADLGFYAPIGYSRAHRGYYYKDPDYSISSMPIQAEEKESVEFVLTLLKQRSGLPFLHRFENFIEKIFTYSKLHSSLDRNLSDYVQFEKPTPVEGLQWIEPLVDAVQLREVVYIQYYSYQRQSPSERMIHPYLLKEYDNRWYVYAFDELSDENRLFGLDRIRSLSAKPGRTFRYFTGNRQELFRHMIGVSMTDNDPQEIILKFCAPQSEYILSKPIHESQEVISRDRNSVTIRLFVRINYELQSLVRGYGTDVEVLKPQSFPL